MKTSRNRRSQPARKKPTQLAFSITGERIRALLDERDRLLERIALKNAQYEELLEQSRQDALAVEKMLEPVQAELYKLNDEIHAMFAQLLADEKRGPRTRQKINDIYTLLQIQGVLGPRAAKPRSAAGAGAPREGRKEVEAPSASRPHERSELRGLFRRLAELLHPDKVQDEQHKAQRTELMKEATAAYHDGDLARLVRLERLVAINGIGGDEDMGEDGERRCAMLTTANAELKRQLRLVELNLREQRRSAGAAMARDIASVKGSRAQAMLAEDMAALRDLHEFVRAYCDGKMTAKDFFKGRLVPQPPPVDMFDDLMGFIIDTAMGFEGSGRKKRGPAKASPGRAKEKKPVSPDRSRSRPSSGAPSAQRGSRSRASGGRGAR